MAIFSSTGAGAPDKSYPQSFPSNIVPPILMGLVQYPLLSPSIQMQIRAIIDETVSASIGDIVAELLGHADAVTAILALVAAGILMLDMRGVLDANTIVSRCHPTPELSGLGGSSSNSSQRPEAQQPEEFPDIERIIANPFDAQLCVGPGTARRSFTRLSDAGPGVFQRQCRGPVLHRRQGPRFRRLAAYRPR